MTFRHNTNLSEGNMRHSVGTVLTIITIPIWLIILIVSFSWQVGTTLSEYLLNDKLAEELKKRRG